MLLALALCGCGLLHSQRCGVFPAVGEVSCFEDFDYSSVVRIESGAESGGVYRCYNSGSGIVIDESGVLVTASHVVNDKRALAVFVDAENSVYAAKPIPGRVDRDLDLAFVRIAGLAREVQGGCVLTDFPAERRFAAATIESQSPRPVTEGTTVQVVGYPGDRPIVLSGRTVDPERRLARYVELSGLPSHLLSEPASPDLEIRASGVLLSDEMARQLGGYETVRRRIQQGCVFVELDSSRRYPGISGGAILLDGEVIGMAVESWNSFDKTILIGVPVPRDP